MDDALVAAIRRGEHPRQIANALHLSEDSIRWRVKHLGHSLREGWYSRADLVALFGVSWRVVNRWMGDGSLRAGRHGTRWTRVTEADLQAFVERYAGVLFDPSAMTPGPLRSLAEVVERSRRLRAV